MYDTHNRGERYTDQYNVQYTPYVACLPLQNKKIKTEKYMPPYPPYLCCFEVTSNLILYNYVSDSIFSYLRISPISSSISVILYKKVP